MNEHTIKSLEAWRHCNCKAMLAFSVTVSMPIAYAWPIVYGVPNTMVMGIYTYRPRPTGIVYRPRPTILDSFIKIVRLGSFQKDGVPPGTYQIKNRRSSTAQAIRGTSCFVSKTPRFTPSNTVRNTVQISPKDRRRSLRISRLTAYNCLLR